MMMLIAILFFFTICCDYAILMENGIGNIMENGIDKIMENGIGSSRGQKRERGNNEANLVPQIDFEANSELAKIFELHDLLAVRGQKLFAHPAILDDFIETLKSTGIVDEFHFHERMTNFLRDILEIAPIQREKANGKEIELTGEQRNRFKKFKYPNSHRLLFQPLLLDAINKVDIQNEIQNELEAIWANENADELRLWQKYLFKFGFIINCIYAYFMDDKQKIDFDKMIRAITTKVIEVEKHQIYSILTENKCASEDEIRIFVNLIIKENAQIHVIHHVPQFFRSYIKDQFVNEMMAYEKKMTGKLKEEYAQLQEDQYFPEKLPKICNLFALLEMTAEIIVQIIGQIKPKDYDNKIKSMEPILDILKLNISEGGKVFFSSHYERAANQIPNEKLRKNLRAISTEETIFTLILKNDIIYPYGKWYNILGVHMIKFLAKNYYGISDLANEDDWEKIGFKIGKSIVHKTLRITGNKEEEEKKKNKMLAQLHLRIFCVGIRYMDTSKRISSPRLNEKGMFHSFMVSELLEFVPGAMEKFNEIIAPKEKLAQNNEHQQKMNLFFEAVSEIRSKMCEKKQKN